VKPKKILVCGLSGSGKSTLAKPLAEMLDAVWLNADEVRKEMDDWDFSDEGRLRQSNRMRFLASLLIESGKNVVADFICPTEETRKDFGPDFTIWVDTTKQSKFADTDAIFETPSQVDYHITEWVDFDFAYCYNIHRKIQGKLIEITRDSGELKNGTRIGNYYKYELDGQMSEDSLFDKDGNFEKKTCYHYYGNGQLKTQSEHDVSGALSGKSTQYFDDGRIMLVEHFKDDRKHGKEISYNNDGSVSQVYTFDDGVLDGPYIRYWNIEGDEGEYRKGELYGKPDEYFSNSKDCKRISTELSGDMSNYSLFTNLKTQQTGGPTASPINRKYFSGESEVWKTDYPTRTDISNIENEKRIIPIFGDSFMFGDGLPTQYELGTLMRKECPDILFPNFGYRGASNNKIIDILEKWTNDEYAHKTDTIIVSMSSMYRFDFFIDAEYPDSIEGINPFHQQVESQLDTIRTYTFSAVNSASVESSLEKEHKKWKRKLKKIVLHANDETLRSQTTYANVYFKNLETSLRRLDWITRAKNWNIILVKNSGWDQELNSKDAMVVNRYIKEMNIKNRGCDTVYMNDGKEATVVDVLDCGHWGHETTKWLARELKNKL